MTDAPAVAPLGSTASRPSSTPLPELISENDCDLVWGRSSDAAVFGLPEECILKAVKLVLSRMGVSAPVASSGSSVGGPFADCTCQRMFMIRSGFVNLVICLLWFLPTGRRWTNFSGSMLLYRETNQSSFLRRSVTSCRGSALMPECFARGFRS